MAERRRDFLNNKIDQYVKFSDFPTTSITVGSQAAPAYTSVSTIRGAMRRGWGKSSGHRSAGVHWKAPYDGGCRLINAVQALDGLAIPAGVYVAQPR